MSLGDTPIEESVWLSYETQGAELKAWEPSDFAYKTTGSIWFVAEDPDRKILAGKFSLYHLDITSAGEEGVSPFDVLDAHSEGISEYYPALFGPDPGASGFSERLEQLLDGDALIGNILVLDRIEILPEFRGRQLGLLVTRKLIQRFAGGAAVVALKPFPLQGEAYAPRERDEWRRALRLAELPTDQRAATRRLRRYYGQLGFVGLRGTPFMFRSTTVRLPTVEELTA